MEIDHTPGFLAAKAAWNAWLVALAHSPAHAHPQAAGNVGFLPFDIEYIYINAPEGCQHGTELGIRTMSPWLCILTHRAATAVQTASERFHVFHCRLPPQQHPLLLSNTCRVCTSGTWRA